MDMSPDAEKLLAVLGKVILTAQQQLKLCDTATIVRAVPEPYRKLLAARRLRAEAANSNRAAAKKLAEATQMEREAADALNPPPPVAEPAP